MDMASKLPEMTDDALNTLGANAERLAQTGTAKQRQAATLLIPAIQAEIEGRQLRNPVKAKTARPRRKKEKDAA